MLVIVQEGKAIVSLMAPLQAHDEALRTTNIREMTEEVKVFYRDYEMVRLEARDGAIEILPAALAGIFWIEKGRRYQLKIGN
jgi:hypothetical protein